MKILILALFMAFTISVKAENIITEIDYVCSNQTEIVRVTVNDKIKLEGWQVLGALSVTCNRYENQFLYCQTLVKYKKVKA